MNALAGKLEELIKIAFNSKVEADYDQWRRRVTEFLNSALGGVTANDFASISIIGWRDRRAAQVGMLEGLVQKILSESNASPSPSVSQPRVAPEASHSKQVFVVHGHDTEAKETVARFIERLGLEPIILHEQASSGRTVIEKFEVFADVCFAVVLLTPDDVGAATSDATKLKRRARQNVVFELGYFV